MKLLTLNTHSLQEENYLQKLEQFVQTICQEKPDVVALQEVNQSVNAIVAEQKFLKRYVHCSNNEIPIRKDNHAAQVAFRLFENGITCSWTWISAKIGYGIYDEGMALLCLNGEIVQTDSFFISECQDYQYWKTRKVLGVQISGCKDWFYTVHMGWWKDEQEPFLAQWKRFESALKQKCNTTTVWLMGDFNSPAEIKEQGYDVIKNSGWYDSYTIAQQKDKGTTVEGSIDGWKDDKHNEQKQKSMRMDYIWCNKAVPVKYSKVMFNGIKQPKVSDHYGVCIETNDIKKGRRSYL